VEDHNESKYAAAITIFRLTLNMMTESENATDDLVHMRYLIDQHDKFEKIIESAKSMQHENQEACGKIIDDWLAGIQETLEEWKAADTIIPAKYMHLMHIIGSAIREHQTLEEAQINTTRADKQTDPVSKAKAG